MACYYLVISSTHLSNGHFRGIKGVFRGPLHRNGSSLPGYAGREKAIANALEDLKANFYCELCDKQYHKHQEFDNHINSYDHAHKQRLKELKQREFARNVASKSWKDEKKQEKALKRLHQLAELRKQSECASRSDPIFKALRTAIEKCPQEEMVTRKDSRSTAVTNCTVMCEGEHFPNSLPAKQQELSQSRDASHAESCPSSGNQMSRPSSDVNNGSHRAGVSFCFSKKAPLKLESSASVFHENAEETNDCSELHNHHRAKQSAENIRPLAHLGDNGEEGKGLTVPQGQSDSPAITQILKESEDENKVLKVIESNQLLNSVETYVSDVGLASSTKEIEKGKEFNGVEKSSETYVSHPCQTNNLYTQQKSCQHSDDVLIDQLTEFSLQTPTEQGHVSEPNCNINMVKTEKALETPDTVFGSMETNMNNSLVEDMNRKTLSFLHVLSKDGNTSLQWPTELLLFTKTQPTLSYGCNPLYFDFKLFKTRKTTKKNEINTDSNEEHLATESMIENENSDLLRDMNMSTEKDNLSLKPKKTNCPLYESPKKKCSSNLNNIDTEESGLKNSKYLNESVSKISLYSDVSEKDLILQNCSGTQKQKRSLKRHLDDHDNMVSSGINATHSFASLDYKFKKLKASNYGLISLEDKFQTQESWKSHLKHYNYNNEISDCEKDSHDSFFSDKSSSYSRYPGCESNGSSVQDWRYSSSGWHSTYSDTSSCNTMSSDAFSEHKSSGHNIRNHKPFFCKRKHKSMEGCKDRKHNCILSSDNEPDHFFHTKSQRTVKSKEKHTIKTQKHKISKKNSKSSSHHRCKSKQNRNGQPHYGRKYMDSRGSHSLERSHSIPASSSESSDYKKLRCNSPGSFSNANIYFLHKTDKESNNDINRYHNTMRKDEPLNGNIQHAAFHSKGCADRFSKNPMQNSTTDEKKSSTVDLLLERVQYKKQEGKTHTPEGISENSRMDMKNFSESFFTVKLPPSVNDTNILPLHENESSIRNNEAATIENGVNKNKVAESQKYELTVTAHMDYDNCLFKDIIRIGTECHYGSTEIQKAVQGSSNPLISQMQPFIQSCKPVPSDLHGAFQSENYSVSTDSTDTKEQQTRLHEESMNSLPREGNSDLYYGRSMQNYVNKDLELQEYNKSASPLVPQPITFSPDEIDKYRILQLQAQQHMQKQFFAKHLKVLPATGPATFSTASTLQPVPLQHHASITTIHHSFLQHCTHATSVHHHASHFPLTHIYPHSHSHFIPISLSPLNPTIIPTHPAFLTGYPIHLLPARAIHPSQLTLQPFPHSALLPTLIAPHLGTGVASSIHIHPLIHPMFHRQDFHHQSGFGHSHS